MKLKIFILFTLFFLSSTLNAQISFSTKHAGGVGKFKSGVIAKFKKTETIFILSNVHDKATYERILSDSWKVTPYKIVDVKDFETKDYLTDKFSFAQLGGHKKISDTKTSLFLYIDFFMFDIEKINKKKDKTKDFQKLANSSKINFARMYLQPKNDFIETALFKKVDETVESMYKEDVFENYTKGMLKNYFQKISSLIEGEEECWMYAKDSKSEIKNLKKLTLFVPEYVDAKRDESNPTNGGKGSEALKKIFEKYDYEYEVISSEELSDKIMEGDEFYYLRAVRINGERFVDVVNAATGEVIYQYYSTTGLAYRIKAKDVDYLNKKIKSGGK